MTVIPNPKYIPTTNPDYQIVERYGIEYEPGDGDDLATIEDIARGLRSAIAKERERCANIVASPKRWDESRSRGEIKGEMMNAIYEQGDCTCLPDLPDGRSQCSCKGSDEIPY